MPRSALKNLISRLNNSLIRSLFLSVPLKQKDFFEVVPGPPIARHRRCRSNLPSPPTQPPLPNPLAPQQLPTPNHALPKQPPTQPPLPNPPRTSTSSPLQNNSPLQINLSPSNRSPLSSPPAHQPPNKKSLPKNTPQQPPHSNNLSAPQQAPHSNNQPANPFTPHSPSPASPHKSLHPLFIPSTNFSFALLFPPFILFSASRASFNVSNHL